MAIDQTLIDIAALGIFRRLRRLESRTQTNEIEFHVNAGGAQLVPVPAGVSISALYINGLKQPAGAFQVAAGNVSVPAGLNVEAGDVLTITYWS